MVTTNTNTHKIQINSFSLQLYLNTHTGARDFNRIINGLYMEFRHSFMVNSLNSFVNNTSTEKKKNEIEMSQNVGLQNINGIYSISFLILFL